MLLYCYHFFRFSNRKCAPHEQRKKNCMKSTRNKTINDFNAMNGNCNNLPSLREIDGSCCSVECFCECFSCLFSLRKLLWILIWINLHGNISGSFPLFDIYRNTGIFLHTMSQVLIGRSFWPLLVCRSHFNERWDCGASEHMRLPSHISWLLTGNQSEGGHSPVPFDRMHSMLTTFVDIQMR